jgi:GNAT superfamily N-acetyltransferase
MKRHEPEPGTSATGVRIRAATEADAAEVQAIADETWRATYVDILPEEAIGQFLVDAYAVPAIGRRIAAADRFEVAIAGDGHSIVGFSEWLPGAAADERVWAATYVRPGWQRRGIGRRFMESAIAGYQGRTTRLLVVVAEANVNGVAFYRAMGFVPVERLASGIYGTPVGEIRLARLLH